MYSIAPLRTHSLVQRSEVAQAQTTLDVQMNAYNEWNNTTNAIFETFLMFGDIVSYVLGSVDAAVVAATLRPSIDLHRAISI
jgi:hypothetical protein